MGQVLYRKYRSQTFTEIVGQKPVKQVLTQAIIDQSIAHAYLFTGPRGTGKTSMARIFAKALNCSQRKGADPCNKCSHCKSINESRFLDLIEIDAASNRGIEEIRNLKEKVGFLPVEGVYKVYIIDEVHMLTSEAFNALLKTLEEPPINVVFILATTEVHKLPQTIISRTQRFDFRMATIEDLRTKLSRILKNEGFILSSDALDLIISAAGGSYRDAETILEKILVSMSSVKEKEVNLKDVAEIMGFANEKYIEDFFSAIHLRDLKNAFSVISLSQQNGVDIGQYIKQLLLKARSELMDSVSGKGSVYSVGLLYKIIKELSEAQDKVKNSPLPSLVLEMAIMNIVQLHHEEGRAILEEEVKKSPKGVVKSLAPKSILGQSSSSESITPIIPRQAKEVDDLKIVFQDLERLWKDLLVLAKENNPHFAALLVKVVLKDLSLDMVSVEVPFKFHQKQLENAKTKKIFAEMTEKVYGKPLSLSVVVNERLIGPVEESVRVDSNESMVEEVFADLV